MVYLKAYQLLIDYNRLEVDMPLNNYLTSVFNPFLFDPFLRSGINTRERERQTKRKRDKYGEKRMVSLFVFCNTGISTLFGYLMTKSSLFIYIVQ